MIRIRVMTTDDLPLGMRLKQQAGWNQTEADWRRLLALQPDGCFVAEHDGTPAGTAATCVFGSVAWVAMVLVDEALRGRGLGTALMRHALAFLDDRGVRTVRLDATPLGQPIYERLGFVAKYQLARYHGTLPLAGGPAPPAEPLLREEIPSLLDLDRAVTGTDRAKLLRRLFDERPDAVRVVRQDGALTGYLTARPGARAAMIGPCVATADAGPALLARAWHDHAGQNVYVDIPVPNRAATQLTEAKGLAVQRHLLRMYRGEPVRDRVADLWASSGPEKG